MAEDPKKLWRRVSSVPSVPPGLNMPGFLKFLNFCWFPYGIPIIPQENFETTKENQQTHQEHFQKPKGNLAESLAKPFRQTQSLVFVLLFVDAFPGWL